MSYNNTYNTRNSGRFTPGRFISGGELAPGGAVGYGRGNRGHNNGMNNQYRQPQRPSQPPAQAPQAERPASPPPPPPMQTMEEQPPMLQSTDVDMKVEAPELTKDSTDSSKPYWMKSKLSGVKKISNKERRRRQNENLRRLLAPKNALMVLNEMLPGEREVAQFKVEPAVTHPYYTAPNAHSFCAELTVDGQNYKGYGDNKIAARNDAAEQAIRDLIIKRMAKVANSVEGSANSPGGVAESEAAAAAAAAGEGDEQPLPMIQLASFALHKLFSEWECDGHKVPQLKTLGQPSASEAGSEASAPATPRAKATRALPANAAAMHPCMLLTYMRPHLEYRELAVDGDRPQNMLFTMGIDVDGSTFIGKATNKREARKQAARAACSTLWGVVFADTPTATTPIKADHA